MPLETRDIARPIPLTAFWGAATGATYAIAESGLVSVGPIVLGQADYLTVTHISWTLLLGLIYLAAGASAGAFIGLASSKLAGAQTWVTEQYQAAASASFALAFAVNVVWSAGLGQFKAPEQAALTAGCLLFLAGVASLFYQPWATRLATVVAPWPATAILIGVPSLVTAQRLSIRAALVATVALIILFDRLWLQTRKDQMLRLRRHVLALVAAAAFMVGAVALRSRHKPAIPDLSRARSERANVVLVVLDTVRADHLSVYGYERQTTPFLEELAREATLYKYVYAPSNFTLPSHASLLTGLYPRSHGAIGFLPGTEKVRPLDRELDTLPEILRAHGYATLAVVANSVFVTREFGFDQGFDVFNDLRPARLLPFSRLWALRSGVCRVLTRALHTDRLYEQFRNGVHITDDALALLEKAAASGRPFFLFVNYMDAHMPYVPPSPYNRRFPGKLRQLTPENQVMLRDEAFTGRRTIRQSERQHFVSQYDGAIAFLDSQLARLVRELKRSGLWDRTLFMVTSDHGEAFGEHQHVDHWSSLYQEQIRVPLLIHFPAQSEQEVVNPPVSLVDLMPTILEVAKIPVPSWVQGRSLLHADELEQRVVFAQNFPHPLITRSRPGYPRIQYAVISMGHKLIVSDNGQEELYDLSFDPGETTNRVRLEPELVMSLRQALEAWSARTPVWSANSQPDPSLIDRLRHFGYMR